MSKLYFWALAALALGAISCGKDVEDIRLEPEFAVPLFSATSRLEDLFGLKYVEGYGLTETAAPSHQNPPDRPKQQCLGIPYISPDLSPESASEGHGCCSH